MPTLRHLTSLVTLIALLLLAMPIAYAAEPLQDDPPTAAELTDAGLTLVEDRDFEGAVDLFTEAITLDEAYAPAYRARADGPGISISGSSVGDKLAGRPGQRA